MRSQIRYLYLAYFSQPSSDREIFRLVRRRGLRRFLELGMADLQRAKRLIEVAAQVSPIEQISYAGIDLFELRSANQGPELSLKQAHRELAATRARVRLVPGDPLSALARSANNLTGQDLIIISADQQGSTLDQAWFWVPRLLHAQTSVAIEVPGPQPHTKQLRWLSRGEIEQRAGSSRLRAA